MPNEQALSKEGVRTNNRAIPWQPSYAYNDPLLFVIPSEAEESAVRHSGAPDLPVYNYCLSFVADRSASQICREQRVLSSEAEGPRRFLLADAHQSFPATNYKRGLASRNK